MEKTCSYFQKIALSLFLAVCSQANARTAARKRDKAFLYKNCVSLESFFLFLFICLRNISFDATSE